VKAALQGRGGRRPGPRLMRAVPCRATGSPHFTFRSGALARHACTRPPPAIVLRILKHFAANKRSRGGRAVNPLTVHGQPPGPRAPLAVHSRGPPRARAMRAAAVVRITVCTRYDARHAVFCSLFSVLHSLFSVRKASAPCSRAHPMRGAGRACGPPRDTPESIHHGNGCHVEINLKLHRETACTIMRRPAASDALPAGIVVACTPEALAPHSIDRCRPVPWERAIQHSSSAGHVNDWQLCHLGTPDLVLRSVFLACSN
jgi:hypothetical protein